MGDDLREDSSVFVVDLTHDSTHPQKNQDGPKQPGLDSDNSGTKQPKVHVIMKRAQNLRDVTMFLGYYSNAKEVVTQKSCDL